MEPGLDIVERVIEGQAPQKLWAEHRARYAFAARQVAGRRVLDVACGSGYGTGMLRAAGAREVIGVDCDAGAVAYARKRYGTSGVTLVQGDACAPPVSGPFDAIVSFETIEHLDEPEKFLEVCRRLLAPGGRLFVSTPYRHRAGPDGKPLNPFHRQEWRTQEFAALLRDFFGEVILYGQALKLEKRRWQLGRRWAAPLARLQGTRLRDPACIYRLPGPRFLGLWKPFPGYLLAVCG